MTTQKTLSPRAWFELLLLSLAWGGSFLAIRVALDEVPVVTSVAYRVLLAALVLWAVVLWRRLSVPADWRTWRAFLVMGLLNNIIPFSLMAWGQLYIETGLTSILNAATAIFAILVAAAVFPDERLTPRKAMGVGLGFLGVATAIGLGNLLSFEPRSLAQLAILLGTLSYALAGAWGRLHLSDVHPVVAAAGMLTGSSLIAVLAALMIDGMPSADLSGPILMAIVYYALVATALAYLLYYRVLAMAGSGNLLLCTLLVAPIAIVLGAVFRNEALGPTSYLGFSLLALGLLILDGRLFRRRKSV
jgi:drug/metabolite transporter (DMT)-like permease